MAKVTKSWLETNCPRCQCRRVFYIGESWVLTCSTCGETKTLEKSGILAA